MDEKEKKIAIKEHQAEKIVGQSWLVHHLNLLKRLLEDNR
jgi:hypothetical protein